MTRSLGDVRKYTTNHFEKAIGKMKIRELQQRIAKALNDVEELVQGGCKAFAEDVRATYDESETWIAAGKVAVVVVTPRMERNGVTQGGIPADTRLLVRCIEKAPVARVQPRVIRALDAAELVMHALDGDQFCWIETDQTADLKKGVLTATATFETTIKLSREPQTTEE